MSDTLQLTCWLTPIEIPAINQVDRSYSSDVLYLMPENCTVNADETVIDLFLQSPADNPVACKYPVTIAAGHVWSGNTAPAHITATAVHASLPRTAHWSGAELLPELTNAPPSIGPTPEAADIESEADAALLIPKDGWYLDLYPVPGEELKVKHHTYGMGSYEKSVYHTCRGLTGGVIVARWPHPTVEEAYLYDVSVEGTLFEDLTTTDFEPRSVGSWCYLLRGAGSGDLLFEPTTSKSPETGELMQIAPLLIAGKG